MKKNPQDKAELISEIRNHYKKNKSAIKSRLKEFRSIPPSEYFYELAFCLLTPQSSAANAEQAVYKLRKSRFHIRQVNPGPILRQKEHYIRFHNAKSGYLTGMKSHFNEISAELRKPYQASEIREWLVTNVIGLGYKEATHFLRNIGKNDGLAILDRHILRLLVKLEVIDSMPKSMTKKRYIEIEQCFKSFASYIGIVLDELDLVFWSLATGEIRK